MKLFCRLPGGSRTLAACKTKPLVSIVRNFQPLTIVTKNSIFDAAAPKLYFILICFCFKWFHPCTIIQTDYIYLSVLFEILFLKSCKFFWKRHVTNCIYFFYFATGGCEKTNFWCSGGEKVGGYEKTNEARGLQKVIGVKRRHEEKVRLYKNCWTANNLCIKKTLHVAINEITCCP